MHEALGRAPQIVGERTAGAQGQVPNGRPEPAVEINKLPKESTEHPKNRPGRIGLLAATGAVGAGKPPPAVWALGGRDQGTGVRAGSRSVRGTVWRAWLRLPVGPWRHRTGRENEAALSGRPPRRSHRGAAHRAGACAPRRPFGRQTIGSGDKIKVASVLVVRCWGEVSGVSRPVERGTCRNYRLRSVLWACTLGSMRPMLMGRAPCARRLMPSPSPNCVSHRRPGSPRACTSGAPASCMVGVVTAADEDNAHLLLPAGGDAAQPCGTRFIQVARISLSATLFERLTRSTSHSPQGSRAEVLSRSVSVRSDRRGNGRPRGQGHDVPPTLRVRGALSRRSICVWA